MRSANIFIAVLPIIWNVRCEEPPIVRLNQGEIRGKLMTTFNEREFYSFRGIPYAKPPVGNLRYKFPEPVEPWTNILDATEDGPICPQKHFVTNEYVGQEDCLIINVYTPKLPNQSESPKLPVMVFIHGGGFVFGDSTTIYFGPKRLLDKDIVYVSMNYRLGALGFLSTVDDVFPGNLGLWDQNLALKWIQENIAAFGGDPDSVTLFGESAGAASVHYHLLSAASKDLFHKAILQSGSALCPWAFQEDPLSVAKDYAKKMDCSFTSSKALMKCLLTKSPEDLINNSSYSPTIPLLKLLFVPAVDMNTRGPKFLEDKPSTLLKKGYFHRHPVITGITKDEGIVFVLELSKDFPKMDLSFIENNFDKVITDTSYLDTESTPHLKKLFFPHLDSSTFDERQFKKSLIDAYSDILFKVAIEDYLQYTSKYVRNYMYILEHTPTQSLARMAGIQENLGVSHADDLCFFFDAVRAPNQLEGKDREVSEKMIDYWTTFAKYGNPNGDGEDADWQPVTREQIKYFRFGYPMELTKYETTDKIKQLRRIVRRFKEKAQAHDEL